MKTDFDITQGAHLGSMNTFGIDAVADVLITYRTPEALPAIAAMLDKEYRGLPVMHLGAGSNLLPAHDFHGIVLKSRITGIGRDGSTIRVGAATVFDDLIAWSLENGLYGLENLSLIPGEVGASAVQNIGAYGAEAKDFIKEVEGYDLQTREWVRLKASDCRYAYRDSIFKHELKNRVAITHVSFTLHSTFTPNLQYAALARAMEGKELTAQSIRREVTAMRRSKLPDPKVLGNAGSFFMNPIVTQQKFDELAALYPGIPHFPAGEGMVKVPAAWLIEQCGWKGRSLGNAAVYERQALVLVNLGGATGQEVLALKDRIVADVAERFGITIHPEANIL